MRFIDENHVDCVLNGLSTCSRNKGIKKEREREKKKTRARVIDLISNCRKLQHATLKIEEFNKSMRKLISLDETN